MTRPTRGIAGKRMAAFARYEREEELRAELRKCLAQWDATRDEGVIDNIVAVVVSRSELNNP